MRLTALIVLAGVVCFATSARAQSAARPAVPTSEMQIAAAVLPLPEEFRGSATVLGYDRTARLTTLREGSGPFICLASAPGGERFHVACYHRTLEPFMARGRALRAEGVAGTAVDSVRYAELKDGRLTLPTHPAALYSLTGAPDSFDPVTRAAPGAQPLFVIYVPGATPESTGLSAKPAEGTPWIMEPGTPKAHIMFIPRMQ
jgi:hypothetical protein